MSSQSYFTFTLREDFAPIPMAEQLTLTLITNGKIVLSINGQKAEIIAPCLFLSSGGCPAALHESSHFTAKSLHFQPAFVNKSLSFEPLNHSDFHEIADEHDHHLLTPFLTRNEHYHGIIHPLPQTFLRISEWFDAAEKESQTNSGKHGLYRIRRCLMQILCLLEETYSLDAGFLSNEPVMDRVLEYIHTHFSKEITLDSLCKRVYLNRTTLSRMFKAHTRRSPIDYLLHYRLNVACELLTNSSLSISKIAEATGFRYENYFARQFMKKIGMTPTQYRQSDGFETLNLDDARIVEEF